ncbi:Fibrous sheath-interacting protein 2 [Orchesella cincta]|uniref:Fibrous sheath-interacting protein 2 n=1 Tax=Orchesella cincta TaxID=48709 RepID=A0A1D2MY74_ORCCI|nr:Fibrous sheath-interacting protein 2 [Orchesella cincta]
MQVLLIMNDSSQAEKEESKPSIKCRHRVRRQCSTRSAYIDANKVYSHQPKLHNIASCIDETRGAANSVGDTFSQEFSEAPEDPLVDCNANQNITANYPKLKARRRLHRQKRNSNANDSSRTGEGKSSNVQDDFDRSGYDEEKERYARQKQYFGSELNFRSGEFKYWQDVEKVWRNEEGNPRLRFERILRHSKRQARYHSVVDQLCDIKFNSHNFVMKSDPNDDRGYSASEDEDLEYEQRGGNTAGNEADIEDNVVPPSTPTPDMLSMKLRMKPTIALPTTPCRLATSREEYKKNGTNLRNTSPGQRLSQRPRSAIETITDTIERPEGSVPPLALPHWHSMPMDKKIPSVPAPKGLLYYSPGKLSTNLHREPRVYSLTDPHNRERVVGSPYTALHDIHAKDYISRPQTRRLLHSQGLINSNDEIMYSLREFNRYRDYLRTLYADDVNSHVHFADELWKCERTQMRSIVKEICQTVGKGAALQKRLNNGRLYRRKVEDYQIARLLRKQKQTEARLIAVAKEKEQINTERVVRSIERNRLQRAKLQSLQRARKEATAQTFHQSAIKGIRSFERKNMDMQLVKQTQESFLMEWIDSKIDHSKARVERERCIQMSSKEGLKMKAAKRQRRVESYRMHLPDLMEKRKSEEDRKWNLAKKYFYIWLERTRKQVAALNKDPSHESAWIHGMVSNTLEETVEYLRFQTGKYEKLDDFIANIVHLKEAIARQIAIEEAEEEMEMLKQQQEQHKMLDEVETKDNPQPHGNEE